MFLLNEVHKTCISFSCKGNEGIFVASAKILGFSFDVLPKYLILVLRMRNVYHAMTREIICLSSLSGTPEWKRNAMVTIYVMFDFEDISP